MALVKENLHGIKILEKFLQSSEPSGMCVACFHDIMQRHAGKKLVTIIVKIVYSSIILE